jgi:thiol-disulfide isomerase/thioredoxin
MKARVLLLMALLAIAGHSFAEDNSAALTTANKALSDNNFHEAEKQFRKLSKANADCIACLLGLGKAEAAIGEFEKAYAAFDEVLKRTQDKHARMSARRLKAEAYISAKNPSKAELELRSAITEEDLPDLHFLLGATLMRLNRDDQGKEELNKFVAATDDSKLAGIARKYIDNPDRVRKPYAPDLSFRALDGEEWSLERLKGKVVVMDFWATWCPPCRASVGELKELVKRYPQDRLVLISISADDDDKTWRDYVSNHKMNWVHYRDQDKSVLKTFGVRGFPTYMIIDGNGLIRKQLSGENPQLSLAGRIKDVLKDMPELKDATGSAR